MKRTIGCILLALILGLLIGITCYVFGWKMGLTVWGIGFAFALIIATAMCLIDEGD